MSQVRSTSLPCGLPCALACGLCYRVSSLKSAKCSVLSIVTHDRSCVALVNQLFVLFTNVTIDVHAEGETQLVYQLAKFIEGLTSKISEGQELALIAANEFCDRLDVCS